MNPMRVTVAHAVRLAGRRGGVTAGELAEVVGCSLRTAQQVLQALAGDGLLTRVVPVRKGAVYGSWRNVYKLAKGGGPGGS